MTRGMVRTVQGDVSPSDLGVTYIHEHLIIDSPAVASNWPHILLADTAISIEEVGLCVQAGVGTMVDAMPMASGRGPERLSEISQATGLHIVMTTGLHTEKYYEELPWVEEATLEELAAWFVADIEVGVEADDHLGDGWHRTGRRAGVIKVATSSAEMTPRAEWLFEAAAIASHETGVPILTHCEEGIGAMEQVEFMVKIGVPLQRVVVSHTDKVSDTGYHTALLESGVNLEFDQALRQGENALGGTASLLASQIERGFLDQLMLGTDGARRSLWTAYGGAPGLAWMAGEYRSVLEAAGIGSEAQHTLFVTNPAEFLTMTDNLQNHPDELYTESNEQSKETT